MICPEPRTVANIQVDMIIWWWPPSPPPAPVHGAAVSGVIGASRPLKVFPQGTDVQLGSVRPGPAGLA